MNILDLSKKIDIKSSLLIIVSTILLYLVFVIAFPLVYATKINQTFPASNSEIISLNEGEKKYRVGVIGDSTAAGQGATSFLDNFSFKYLEKISKEGYNLEYQNLAVSGSRVENVIDEQLPKLTEFKPDLVMVSIGANDVITSISEQEYGLKLKEISSFLVNLNAKVIWLNIPDFITSPILLPPLNIILSKRSGHFNQILESTINNKPKFVIVDVYNGAREDFKDKTKGCFAIDAYHPSSNGYEVWSELIYKANPRL